MEEREEKGLESSPYKELDSDACPFQSRVLLCLLQQVLLC